MLFYLRRIVYRSDCRSIWMVHVRTRNTSESGRKYVTASFAQLRDYDAARRRPPPTGADSS